MVFPKPLASTPEWASKHNLEICGQYYQGFVDDFEAVLSQHRMCTVTASHVHCDNVWCKEVQVQCKQPQHYIWYRKGE